MNKIDVGTKAPDFSLPDSNGSTWSLSAMAGNVVVLLFYPQSETLVCNRQLCSVRDNWQDYLKTKAVIAGVSPGTTEEHTSFADKYYLPIPLLADPGRKITSIYVQHSIFPINLTRGVVVIDSNGVIRTRQIMLRAFRPRDTDVLTAIHAARADAIDAEYQKLRVRIRKTI